MQTLSSGEIDYITASFRAWCAAEGRTAPTADDALAYFSHVQDHEPFVAERIDGDLEDFVAFLREWRLMEDP